ncbi:transposase [Roseivivax sp. CAU 1761]
MKASRFTEAHEAFILKQGEQGTAVSEVCRRAGIRQRTGSIPHSAVIAMPCAVGRFHTTDAAKRISSTLSEPST